jgi:hypothetical protein
MRSWARLLGCLASFAQGCADDGSRLDPDASTGISFEFRIEYVQGGPGGVCLARPLVGPNGVPIATGEHAECVVWEIPAGGGACGPGRVEVESREGDAVCQVCQEGDGSGDFRIDSFGTDLAACASSPDAYWFYTTADESCGGAGKIEFSAAGTPAVGSTVQIICLEERTR